MTVMEAAIKNMVPVVGPVPAPPAMFMWKPSGWIK
jgi:hypothetical protein